MMRNPNDNNYFVSPIRSPGEFDESVHSDAKKSKNRHLAIINQLRRREDAWDGRFHLENIPNYRFNEDKHCETYKKMLIKKKNKKIVVRADSKIQTPSDIGIRKRNYEDQSADYNYRRPDSQQSAIGVNGLRGINPRNIQSRDKSRGDSLNRKYTPLQETLLKEKKYQEERLAALWDKWNIPMFHRETFLKCENAQNPKQTIEILRREADDIEATCSAIQLGLRAVTARENCLKQLKLLVNKLERSEAGSNNDLINEEDAKQKASELLTHLRILSLNAVETILKWREYIQQAYYITRGVVKANQTIIIPFLFNDNNYLIKMKNDIKNLTESSLARFFNFSSKSDPFLVYPSKETNGVDDKIVLYISKNLINRIRACELVILEESVHEHMSDKGTPQTAGKVHDTDRSAPKNEDKAGQRPSNIRIRNVSNKTDNKKLSAGPTSATHKPGSETKITTGSQGGIPEPRHDTHHKDQPVSEQPKQASSVDKISDHAMSPERDSPKKTEQKSPERETIKSDYSQTFSPVKESPKKVDSPAKKDHAHIHLISPVKGIASEHVKPVDVYEDEIEALVTEYLRDVDDSMKSSFISDPKVLLERANMGQDPTWFKLINVEDGHKRVGFAVTHIDNNVFTTRRMVILHCTTVNRELYAEYLGRLVEYLWNSDECNEIKISLYHVEDANANLGADKELSEAIKKLGFRWKQLTNDKITGKRYIDYILKRPEGKVYQGQKFNDEPIHVESVVVLSDLQGADLNQSYEHKELVDNRFAILGAVLKHCEEKVDQLAEGDSKRHKNYLTHITSLIKEEKAKIGEIVEKFHNLDEMVNFVGQKFENKDEFLPTIDQKHLNNKYTTSLLNLIYRWKSFNITHHKVAGQDREYLKINNNTDLVQFQSKYESSSIYFIPTDDAQVNIYLTDNQTLVNKIINKEEIIEDVVSKLFSKLDKNPTAFDKDLWIPMFSMHQRNVDLETAKELLKGEDKINFAKSTNIIGLNGNRVNGNLKVRPSEKSKIIEKAFLFGIVHEHVDFPMVSVVVQPEDFVEYNI